MKNPFDRKYLPIILHLAAWGILLILPLYLFRIGNGGDRVNLERHYYRTFIYGLIFYLNYLWLIPAILNKGRRLTYTVSLITILFVLFFAMEYGSRILFPINAHDIKMQQAFEKAMKETGIPKRPDLPYHVFNYIFVSLLVTGFSGGLRIMDRLAMNEKMRKELEKERLNSELAMLKNQVSPHFFFNTMNNIYSLIQVNPEDAQKAVLKLSGLMRYLLYESEHGDTMLGKEIEFLKNYIDLMKLRLVQKVKLEIKFPETFRDRPCPPLLFIPFVENAFKHGISFRDPSSIEISITIEETQLIFHCRNTLVNPSDDPIRNNSGIGLENVQKRLNLLFPERHTLLIEKTDSFFEVKLTITK